MSAVLNVRDYPTGLPANVVRVSRPSPWGNPFYITDRHPRRDVVSEFRRYAEARLRDEPDWLEPLRGRDLACYCAPLECHGDVLLELLYGFEVSDSPEKTT